MQWYSPDACCSAVTHTCAKLCHIFLVLRHQYSSVASSWIYSTRGSATISVACDTSRRHWLCSCTSSCLGLRRNLRNSGRINDCFAGSGSQVHRCGHLLHPCFAARPRCQLCRGLFYAKQRAASEGCIRCGAGRFWSSCGQHCKLLHEKNGCQDCCQCPS